MNDTPSRAEFALKVEQLVLAAEEAMFLLGKISGHLSYSSGEGVAPGKTAMYHLRHYAGHLEVIGNELKALVFDPKYPKD